jgi:DNA-binding IclR family transcriptional regulator
MDTNISLRRGLKVLDLLAGRHPVTFSYLRERLGDVPATTLSRLLKVLLEEGWVLRDAQGHYCLAPGGVDFARRCIGGLDEGELLAPLVERLAEETGESAAFAQFREIGFFFLAKREAPSSYHYIPLYQLNPDLKDNGFGFLCLAFQRDDLIRYRLAAMDGLTEAEREAFLANYAAYRERGVQAHLAGEQPVFVVEDPKALRILAPVFIRRAGSDNGESCLQRVRGIIGISRLNKNDRENIDALERRVADAALRASELLVEKL